MTDSMALKKAKAKWGSKVVLQKTGKVYSIGLVTLGLFIRVLGQGKSWEEAFKVVENNSAAKGK